MPTEIKKKIELEVVHVLFLDIVGYSTRLTNEQQTLIDQLNQVVRSSEEFQSAEAARRLIKIPTGDGMALVFYKSPAQPVECALEISRALKSYPELRVRMGVHSGPVSAVTDLNDRTNAAGIGINIAQRVMDCGDAGHILLSQRVAEDLAQYGEWQPQLHDLGEVEAKHGLRIHVFNLYTEDVGNPEAPEKLRQAQTTVVTVSAASDASTRREEGFWVAVLPFKYVGANADLGALAEGLSEDIVTGLSRFSYLRVIARSSTLRLAKDSGDVRAVGKQLGARYVMEGSLRHAGSMFRVSVQLVDTATGTHLWAETYDRVFQPEAIFALQDELVPRIVSTVADQHGVLIHSMAEELRNKGKDQFGPYDAVLSVFGFHERMSPEEHASLRDVLERVVHDFPDQGNCWAMLETLYCDEYMFGFNVRPDPLGRAVAAAQRALELAPTSNLASQALAQALFFRRELSAFRPVAERTIALNPMDGATVALMGLLIACSGDWEKGCAVTESAMQLNPHFPGWYRFTSIFNAYRQKDYRGTVDGTLRVNIPGYFWTLVMSAAAHGQLGETAAAQYSLRELLKSKPDFALNARDELGRWFDRELVEHLIEGLQKAGLDRAANLASSTPSHASPLASERRSDEGFWVAVLPFKYSGSNADLTALAEGLTEEIVTGLSRFSYLKVIARGSTARYANESIDMRSAGKQLGARYVMEGSLRQARARLRTAVQLVDTNSGVHLWAETYDRPFQSKAVFELQDDLVPRIVSTCADRFGVLARNISDAIRGSDPAQLTPYEALMRGFGYHHRLTAAEHAEACEALERAVEKAPSNADCWAMLSWIYSHEYAHGFNVRPGSLERALAAARRAVDIAPSNQLAQQALAVVLFFRNERAGCRSAAERALALNPLDTSNEAMFLITFTGEWDRGCALIRRAMELNPHHPRWYGTVLGINEYRLANYRAVIDEVVKANAPDVFWTNMLLAAAHGQLGELTAARTALRDLLAQKEDFAQSAGQLLSKWFDPQLVGHLIEGLRSAGLDTPSARVFGSFRHGGGTRRR